MPSNPKKTQNGTTKSLEKQRQHINPDGESHFNLPAVNTGFKFVITRNTTKYFPPETLIPPNLVHTESEYDLPQDNLPAPAPAPAPASTPFLGKREIKSPDRYTEQNKHRQEPLVEEQSAELSNGATHELSHTNELSQNSEKVGNYLGMNMTAFDTTSSDPSKAQTAKPLTINFPPPPPVKNEASSIQQVPSRSNTPIGKEEPPKENSVVSVSPNPANEIEPYSEEDEQKKKEKKEEKKTSGALNTISVNSSNFYGKDDIETQAKIIIDLQKSLNELQIKKQKLEAKKQRSGNGQTLLQQIEKNIQTTKNDIETHTKLIQKIKTKLNINNLQQPQPPNPVYLMETLQQQPTTTTKKKDKTNTKTQRILNFLSKMTKKGHSKTQGGGKSIKSGMHNHQTTKKNKKKWQSPELVIKT